MLYRYKIAPRSPLITPLMSDTFFGHFCWALYYSHGEEYLTGFLGSFGVGKPAPVIFSSAFIAGCLPRPTLPAPTREEIREFVRGHFETEIDGFSTVKIWNKRDVISMDQWLEIKDDFTVVKLYEGFLKRDVPGDNKLFEIEMAASNTISRLIGSVPREGGGLFQREKTWWRQGVELDLYVEINDAEMEKKVTWFLEEHLADEGYGADKSTGMGSLSIKRDESFDEKIFSVAAPNARLSLSLASFAGIETHDACYRLKTKFGKLGGNYAVCNPRGGNPRPFKKPVLMYEPGAVFFRSKSLSHGPLLDHVHSDEKIRHCGIPITLAFTIREDSRYVRTSA